MNLSLGGRASKGGFLVALRIRTQRSLSLPPTANAKARIRPFHSRTQSSAPPLGFRTAVASPKPTNRSRCNQKLVRFSSRPNNESKGLSRKERRLLERKERNKAKRMSKIQQRQQQQQQQATESGSQNSASSNFWKRISGENFSRQRFQNLLESYAPRIPGRNVSFTHRSLWMALGMRLPLFVALSYVITNEKTSPYVVQGSLGPSMLPTIQFVGDIWLVETKAWKKAMNWALGNQEVDLNSMYSVGDLVIWEDTNTGKRSCKRIVGLEGDIVDRYGEHRNVYKSRSDDGILWPKKGRGDHVFGAFSRPTNEKENDGSEAEEEIQEESGKIVVPKQCVWLEGDCPLFSMDSRQYGPIHSSHIRGRLVFRIWPWNRDDLTNDEQNSHLSSCWISKKRPIPYPTIDAYIGKRFGLYRVEASSDINS